MCVRRSIVAAVFLAVLAGAWAGCSDSPGRLRVVGPLPPSSPSADSPENALRLLEWCWNHLDTTAYRTLFTDDYRFAFGTLDPGGAPYRDTPFTREDELAALACLANGGALSIDVLLDRNLRVSDDPRYPGSGRWKKLIRTVASIRLVDASGSQADVTGYANFFVVRGDSAWIPADLEARGIRPDSTRWYLARWEDDTFPPGARAAPVEKQTWGSIKLLCP